MYYGWLIVGIVMLTAFLGAGLNNVTMAVLLKPLSEDQGWSRTLTSGAISAGTLLAGLLAPWIGRLAGRLRPPPLLPGGGAAPAPWIGRLADRIGPRLLIPVGAAAVGALAMLISQVAAPWQFYATYVP